MTPEEQQIYTAILDVRTMLASNTATLHALDDKVDTHIHQDASDFTRVSAHHTELFGRINSLETSRDTMKGFAKVSVLISIGATVLAGFAKIKGFF